MGFVPPKHVDTQGCGFLKGKMFYSLLLPGFRRIILVVFACCLSISGNRLSAQTPAPPSPPRDTAAKTDSTAKSSPSAGPSEEVSSRETPTTFKVRVNLVLVRVVVRDRQGKIVSKKTTDNLVFHRGDTRDPHGLSSSICGRRGLFVECGCSRRQSRRSAAAICLHGFRRRAPLDVRRYVRP